MDLLLFWRIALWTILILLIWGTYRYIRGTFRIRAELLHSQLKRELEVIEAERGRIANDLHDDLGSLLAVVSARMASLTVNSDQDKENLEKMKTYLHHAIERVGKISFNLTPQTLIRGGLDEALKEFFYHYQELHTTQLEYVYTVNGTIPHAKALHLYRIVQELVHNGLKHARASLLRVHLIENDGVIQLLYKDDGVGFSDRAAEEFRGLGLNSLRNRTTILHGKMTFSTKRGCGVEYRFEIPL